MKKYLKKKKVWSQIFILSCYLTTHIEQEAHGENFFMSLKLVRGAFLISTDIDTRKLLD